MSDILSTGQCLCGNVKYTLTGQPLRMAQCHCKDCQRASGTGHMSLAFFTDEQVQVTGNLASYGVTADSGNTNTRHFCPDCGSRLFGTNSAKAGIRGVAIGCVDNHDWFEPGAIVYCKDRAAWDITSDEVPNFDAMPPPPPAK